MHQVMYATESFAKPLLFVVLTFFRCFVVRILGRVCFAHQSSTGVEAWGRSIFFFTSYRQKRHQIFSKTALVREKYHLNPPPLFSFRMCNSKLDLVSLFQMKRGRIGHGYPSEMRAGGVLADPAREFLVTTVVVNTATLAADCWLRSEHHDNISWLRTRSKFRVKVPGLRQQIRACLRLKKVKSKLARK